MPRQVQRGSSSGRQSTSTSDHYHAILVATKSCENVLENASRTLMQTTTFFDEVTSKKLALDIMTLANDNAQVNGTVAYAKRNLELMEPDADKTPKENVKKMKNDLTEHSKTDTSRSANVLKIGKILKMGEPLEEEEEIEEIETADKISDFKCPYTITTIDIPMKNPSCRHIISMTGLNEMCRMRKFDCPVAGCRAKWTKAHSSIDVDFQKRMQRFFRVHKQTEGGTERMSGPVATEILDDDEEYTQI
mmetsp:Transcript_14874/g.24611  ORF Transcript_14874/g.24611 Transcript_14874/m.24611 type:complete len:248 (-) Transcript_14874:308-1051(-)|eukprot:CAMPEP_0114419350 /NCGR_PEP_ID=MMETSP0103-20121206/3977_1 /TAXON_ID=37642 ORGANISM="Paraphysomonas imperforata, Strain PA2" /NCGR_SAMPLE_ID=MMETSP0103 /ASSEMBLY_ACC=CAM_ASM_000201 /LENGTH=247 /DNA_ID=CAMNT_0001587757 /DNA_START=81 /DNA_END=824 /DNA_ORIENTATION=+